MNKFRVVFMISLASVLCLSAPPCFGGWFRSKVDGHSGATRSAKEKKVSLPLAGDEYEVFGVLPGLKNYVVQYSEMLYRGGEPQKPSAAKTLRKLGVKTIISITPNDYEREFCQKYKFTLIEIPFAKDDPALSKHIQRFVDIIRSENGSFYLHCHGGTHRAGILAASYRVFIQNWPVEKALKEYDVLGGDPETDGPMIDALRLMAP